MIDPIENILSRLDGVKETKPDQWIAICPSHADRNPSLAIKRGEDGRVLLKCWAGCRAGDVVEDTGLELKDLFDQPIKCRKPSRQRLYPNYKKILQMLRHDVMLIWIITEDMAAGKVIPTEDINSVRRAYKNIESVMEASNV